MAAPGFVTGCRQLTYRETYEKEVLTKGVPEAGCVPAFF